MKIVVCVKQVPDTATKIKVGGDGRSVDIGDATMVVNPYDEFAVEEALKLKEKHGGEVVIVSAGSEKASAALRNCLALGADSAVLVQSDLFEKSGSFAIGSALARVCRELKPDLILFGKHAIGVDNAQVPAVVAEILDLPQVSVVLKLDVNGGRFRAEREIEGAREIVEGSLPAIVTAQKGLNTPRYASLKGIMAAKKKQIEVRTPEQLGMASDDLEERLATVEVSLPPSRPPGRVLTGNVSDTVPQLVRWLHEEAKII